MHPAIRVIRKRKEYILMDFLEQLPDVFAEFEDDFDMNTPEDDDFRADEDMGGLEENEYDADADTTNLLELYLGRDALSDLSSVAKDIDDDDDFDLDDDDDDDNDNDDLDDDGDSVFECFLDQQVSHHTYIQVPSDGENPAGLYEFGRFDPNNTDMSHIVGDPISFIDNWHHQQTDHTCATVAQKMIIEELLGISLDEMELRELAMENGWLSLDGTVPQDMGRLMEHYGLDVRYQFLEDLDDLRDCLASGGCPVVGLDADELWSGKNDEWFLPGRDANHAVQVIGIDESDPDNPMVILNDSGVPDGAGVMVPGDLFMKAAEDNGALMKDLDGPWGSGFMVVAYR